MKKYWQFFKVNFQNFLEYREDLAISFLIKLAIVVAFIFIWTRIEEEGGEIIGYGLSGIIVYYLVTQVLDGLYSSQIARALRDDVIRGELSNKLVKPVSPLPFFFSQHVARVLSETVMYVALAIPIFIVKPDLLDFLPFRIESLLYTLIIFVLACVIGFNVFLLAGLIAFWTKESSGMQAVIKNAAKFFTGALIPIDLLPDYFSKVIMLTPFPYIIFFPTKILMGDVSFREFIIGCLIVVSWIVILTMANVAIWKRGLKRYESVGI
ncbi:ABC-2 family transporter protein [Candidatus Dojkabacteria bacterium]|nr:ABC-2 family transporter protein [Candidatus Dojkabacteria bacterium]